MTKRAVLGRGLNALLSETPTTSSEELTEINIDLIDPNPLQPRTRFDESQLEELAQSIRENGVVQPILARRVEHNRYQIVAGERRWRAAQRAGLQRIPAVLRDIPEDKILELALIENIQRQELNAIEEAYAYKKLIETLNLTQETVAQRVGRDRTFITNYLRLLRLPEDIQQMVETGKLSMGHARALLGIDDADTQRKIAQRILEQGLSVRETERAVKKVIAGEEAETVKEPQTTEAPTVDPNVRAAEDKLRRRLGTQVRINPSANGKGGKIEVHYFSDNDLLRIYDLLLPIN